MTVEENENFEIVPKESLEESVEAGISQKGRLGMIELIYGTLFHPVETFRKVGQAPPVFNSFLIFSIVIIVNLLISISLAPHSLAKTAIPGPFAEALKGVIPFTAVIGAVFAYIIWIVSAGVLHLLAELFEGRGSALGVFSFLGLIELPRLVTLPFQVVGTVVNQSFISTFLTVLGSFLYLIWWSILMVIGIREIHGLSTGKSLAVLLLPLILLGMAMVIIFIASMGLIVPLMDMLIKS